MRSAAPMRACSLCAAPMNVSRSREVNDFTSPSLYGTVLITESISRMMASGVTLFARGSMRCSCSGELNGRKKRETSEREFERRGKERCH